MATAMIRSVGARATATAARGGESSKRASMPVAAPPTVAGPARLRAGRSIRGPQLAAARVSKGTPSRRSLTVTASSAATASLAAVADEPPKWQGANRKTLAYAVLTGLIVWLIPTPAGLLEMENGQKAWQLLAIFMGTIVGIITQPLPLGAVALLGLGATMVTQTLTFKAAFSAMSSEIPWLIALAFFFAKGFIKTGLGNRVAYLFVSLFGKTTLGLSYSLVFSEALLSPAIPSLAARAGGIFLPLVRALSEACGSRPDDGTEKKLGAYLMQTSFQTSCVSSAMFLTAMAANPLSANLAAAAIGTTISWTQWATAAIVPGLVSLITIPLLMYVIFPPEVKNSPEAPAQAKEQLKAMGPMSSDEKVMAVTLVVTVGLWIFGGSFGIGSVAAAICGLGILLTFGTVTWKECLGQGVAWDTLTWFAALIAMADYLNKYGLIKWFSNGVTDLVGGLGLAWQASLLILTLLYFYSHYLFASGAAHIGAMYTAFLSVAVALGCPPMMVALLLAFASNLMGCISHYGIGSAPPFYGAGYVSLSDWFRLGFIVSVVNLVIWMGIGGAWWKILGLW
eukprot:scaffold3965_cov414-Prasinococcus_capsulatus_cf.AAC.3